jgi:hypothetical protein
MARRGRNTSVVRSTKSGERPLNNTGGPTSWIGLEAIGEGDI